MAPLHNSENASPLKRFLRFGIFRGLRSVEIDPEDFRAYLARKQAEGKSRREAIRCLKRHLARRVWHLLTNDPTETPRTTAALT